MNKVIILIFIISANCAAFAQEKENVGKPEAPTGLTLGIDYYSDYLWRGTKLFNGDGAIVPRISWKVFNTGLTLSVLSEVSQSFLWEGFQNKPERYFLHLNDDLSIYWTKKSLKFNHIAYSNQSFDGGADYSYKIKDAVTIGAGIWYWWYYNSGRSTELALKYIVGLNKWSWVDTSRLSTTFIIGLDFVPWINPKLSVTNDYYPILKKSGDFYTEASFGHDFWLTKEVKLAPGGFVGYYYNRTNRTNNYYWYYNPTANALSPRLQRLRLIKGVSNITPYISLAFVKGALVLKAGFYWCIVPARSWYKGDSPHRYYANLGLSYTI